ncbi:hypothetical protein, partial [Paraburkholderia silvatlantica]|uniref:hypothetical protein n=1 Tax=Paraburkholderia silvatlantica TaxID=321895 RepID=UPI001C647FA1
SLQCQACHHAYWCLLLETLHHLVKHSFVPAILEQAARLPGLTHKDLERAGPKRFRGEPFLVHSTFFGYPFFAVNLG